MHILSANNVYRDFKTATGTLSVLKGISMNLQKGETAAVTGASGVGKSTLLHILGGLDKPTRGEVSISDVPLHSRSEKELARFRVNTVGFVFQFHYLLDDFTALENVMIPHLLAGRKTAEAAERGEQLLQEVGLSERRGHRPKELSGGEQQRVAVARALANNPAVVLADEPSGNLDTATGGALHELLFRLAREKQVTFLIATHNRDLAAHCDREFQMADGRIVEVR
ncbi:MAG: ABC transporter ATP-binding protein [candidate division Zixibacteria bacterium]|nr:ABC transporter ATP-binding protein [candidate division Zixibacteria bacterium]